MKNDYALKLLLITIFLAMFIILILSPISYIIKEDVIYLIWGTISLGFIGVFLFLKLIHDRIR